MLVNRKVWMGLTLVATGGIAMAGLAGAAGSYPGGDFSGALKKVLAGEGGEGGIGFVKSGRSISAPALDDAQITEAFSGNTLHSHKAFAYHFDKSGSVDGWEVQWTQIDATKCAGLESTPNKNTGYGDKSTHLFDKECWRKDIPQATAAKWLVRDGMLCTQPALPALTGKGDCGTVYMVFDRIALYGSDDKMVGKGGSLSPGSHLEE